MIPWIYHRLTPRDQAGDLLRVENFQGQASGAGSILTYQVPPERLLLITSLNVYQQDIAAFPLGLLFAVTIDTTTVINYNMVRDVQQTGPLAEIRYIYERSGAPWLIVSPNHVLNFVTIGGSAAGQMIASFNGILVPHGTFSE